MFDVGAAEALFTLDNIELVKHAYIIEAEEVWIKALLSPLVHVKTR